MKVVFEVNDRVVAVARAVLNRRALSRWLAGGLLFSAGWVMAGTTNPGAFQEGDVLTADALNQRFDALFSGVAALEGAPQPVVHVANMAAAPDSDGAADPVDQATEIPGWHASFKLTNDAQAVRVGLGATVYASRNTDIAPANKGSTCIFYAKIGDETCARFVHTASRFETNPVVQTGEASYTTPFGYCTNGDQGFKAGQVVTVTLFRTRNNTDLVCSLGANSGLDFIELQELPTFSWAE